MAGSRNKSPLSGRAPGRKKQPMKVSAELSYSFFKKSVQAIAPSKIWPARQRTLLLTPLREMDTMLRIIDR